MIVERDMVLDLLIGLDQIADELDAGDVLEATLRDADVAGLGGPAVEYLGGPVAGYC